MVVTPICIWIAFVVVVLTSYSCVFLLRVRNLPLVAAPVSGRCLRVLIGGVGKRVLLSSGAFGAVCRRWVILIGLLVLRRATTIRLLLFRLRICIYMAVFTSRRGIEHRLPLKSTTGAPAGIIWAALNVIANGSVVIGRSWRCLLVSTLVGICWAI